MISFITAFKPFKDLYTVIQKSCLYSYHLNNIPIIAADTESDALQYDKNIILIENVRTARDLNFNNNAPIIKDLLIKGLEKIDTPYVGFINSDIIIPINFREKLEAILNNIDDEKAFIAFTRYDLKITEEVKTKEELERISDCIGRIYDQSTSSDLIISKKRLLLDMAEEMPEFILGRYGWDNWIHYYANQNLSCYNGTKAIKTYHCLHDHQHIYEQEGFPGKEAPSSGYNIQLLKNEPTIKITDWKYL